MADVRPVATKQDLAVAVARAGAANSAAGVSAAVVGAAKKNPLAHDEETYAALFPAVARVVVVIDCVVPVAVGCPAAVAAEYVVFVARMAEVDVGATSSLVTAPSAAPSAWHDILPCLVRELFGRVVPAVRYVTAAVVLVAWEKLNLGIGFAMAHQLRLLAAQSVFSAVVAA